MVFIDNKLTERLVASRVIAEQISTPRRLYQYLNWTMRLNKMAQSTLTMEGRNGYRVLLIDVELHDRYGRGLYALCILNDKDAPKWQLAALMPPIELFKYLGLCCSKSLCSFW